MVKSGRGTLSSFPEHMVAAHKISIEKNNLPQNLEAEFRRAMCTPVSLVALFSHKVETAQVSGDG